MKNIFCIIILTKANSEKKMVKQPGKKTGRIIKAIKRLSDTRVGKFVLKHTTKERVETLRLIFVWIQVINSSPGCLLEQLICLTLNYVAKKKSFVLFSLIVTALLPQPAEAAVVVSKVRTGRRLKRHPLAWLEDRVYDEWLGTIYRKGIGNNFLADDEYPLGSFFWFYYQVLPMMRGIPSEVVDVDEFLDFQELLYEAKKTQALQRLTEAAGKTKIERLAPLVSPGLLPAFKVKPKVEHLPDVFRYHNEWTRFKFGPPKF